MESVSDGAVVTSTAVSVQQSSFEGEKPIMLNELAQETILNDTYVTRPATMDDVVAMAELANACSIDEIGKPDSTPELFRTEWETPGLNLETDTRLVFAHNGQLVGYVDVWDMQSLHVRIPSWGCVHPEHRGQGVGNWLLQFAEDRARQSIPLAPEGARVVFRSGAISSNASARALFEGRGYTLLRHFLRMVIELDESPPAPTIPNGLTIRAYDPDQDDLADICRAQVDAFKDHWGHVETPFEEGFARWKHFWESHTHSEPSLWFLAMDGDEIAGISLCMTHIDEDPEMGWVEILGVRRAWRRRGLALALLQHSFGAFYRRGKQRAGLGVDAGSLTGATRLYEKAGMKAIRQFDLYEKELRAGEDLTRQALAPQGE